MVTHADSALAVLETAKTRLADIEARYLAHRQQHGAEASDPKQRTVAAELRTARAHARDDLADATAAIAAAEAADLEVEQAEALAAATARRKKLGVAVRARIATAAKLDVAAAEFRALVTAEREAGIKRHALAGEVMAFAPNDRGIDLASHVIPAICGTSHAAARALAELIYVVIGAAGLSEEIRPFLVMNLFALDQVTEPMSFEAAARADADHTLPHLGAQS